METLFLVDFNLFSLLDWSVLLFYSIYLFCCDFLILIIAVVENERERKKDLFTYVIIDKRNDNEILLKKYI